MCNYNIKPNLVIKLIIIGLLFYSCSDETNGDSETDCVENAGVINAKINGNTYSNVCDSVQVVKTPTGIFDQISIGHISQIDPNSPPPSHINIDIISTSEIYEECITYQNGDYNHEVDNSVTIFTINCWDNIMSGLDLYNNDKYSKLDTPVTFMLCIEKFDDTKVGGTFSGELIKSDNTIVNISEGTFSFEY